MKRMLLAVIGSTITLLLATNTHARWHHGWDYGWWSPRPVQETVDTHTFTGTVESMNSTQMVITVNGRENYKTRTRWENAYVVKPIQKPISTYDGYEDTPKKAPTTDSQTFKIAVSCRVITDNNLHARLADINAGDTVTIGHSLDYKNNCIATEITVNKSKQVELKANRKRAK